MEKPKKEILLHKEKAIKAIDEYLDKQISDRDKSKNIKADKFCYWLEEYITFLDFEKSFNPNSLRRYKRGEIVKANLGYNIGSEEGGLHYCVVIDKNNSINSPVITIVPLTSIKPKTDLNHLYPTQVYLGNELFTSLNAKISSNIRNANEKVSSLKQIINSLKQNDQLENSAILSDIEKEIEDVKKKIALIESMKTEINRMKEGSIALVNQVRVISKIRIRDPKRNDDVLSNIKLSNDKLDAIDKAIISTYTNISEEIC